LPPHLFFACNIAEILSQLIRPTQLQAKMIFSVRQLLSIQALKASRRAKYSV
jgi:hypothetical protein